MTYCIDINKNINNMIIRFKLDNDAPEDFIKKWVELKIKCESRDDTSYKEIIEQWLKHCKIKSNKLLPFLDRHELGIGGDDNIIKKQLRFRNLSNKQLFDDPYIIIDEIYSTDNEKWNYEELHDLINAFKIYADNYINADSCINGFIEFNISSKFNYQDNSPDDDNFKYNKMKESLDCKSYLLEVCKFEDNDDHHVGYMKARFRSKQYACSYYNRHNPHMRELNARGTFESDWDPKTKLFYIVREDYGLLDNISPFSKDDLPINGSYKYLK